MARQIVSSSAILFVLYDPSRRAPDSEGDFLGILSLGCAMERKWQPKLRSCSMSRISFP